MVSPLNIKKVIKRRILLGKKESRQLNDSNLDLLCMMTDDYSFSKMLFRLYE